MKTLKRLTSIIVLAHLLCMIAATCHAQTPFKGIELNSWKPQSKDWHFSLLMGTNRNKTIEEITDSKVVIVGVAELEQRLAKLPKGENVYWNNYAKEPVPKNIVEELSKFSKQIRINLHIFNQ
jgi:hypothetical protein